MTPGWEEKLPRGAAGSAGAAGAAGAAGWLVQASNIKNVEIPCVLLEVDGK